MNSLKHGLRLGIAPCNTFGWLRLRLKVFFFFFHFYCSVRYFKILFLIFIRELRWKVQKITFDFDHLKRYCTTTSFPKKHRAYHKLKFLSAEIYFNSNTIYLIYFYSNTIYFTSVYFLSCECNILYFNWRVLQGFSTC